MSFETISEAVLEVNDGPPEIVLDGTRGKQVRERRGGGDGVGEERSEERGGDNYDGGTYSHGQL